MQDDGWYNSLVGNTSRSWHKTGAPLTMRPRRRDTFQVGAYYMTVEFELT